MTAREAKEKFYQKEAQTKNSLFNYLHSKSMEEYFNLKIKLAIEELNPKVYLALANKKIDDNTYHRQTIRNYFEGAGYKIYNIDTGMGQIAGLTIQIPLSY